MFDTDSLLLCFVFVGFCVFLLLSVVFVACFRFGVCSCLRFGFFFSFSCLVFLRFCVCAFLRLCFVVCCSFVAFFLFLRFCVFAFCHF